MLRVWLGAAWWAGPAAAEGTAQTGAVLELRADVRLLVDVLAAGETLSWSGRVADPAGGPDVEVSLSLTDPLGVAFGVFPSGSLTPALPLAGAWEAEVVGVDLDAD